MGKSADLIRFDRVAGRYHVAVAGFEQIFVLRPRALALEAGTHVDIHVQALASPVPGVIVKYVTDLRSFSLPGDMVPPPTMEGPGYLIALGPPNCSQPPFFVTID